MISTSKKARLIRPSMFLALALAGCFVIPAAHATTVAVGTCTNYIYFSTIQAAVNAVPAGSTIEVCPSTYSEQVRITKKVTLKGLSFGNGSGALITAPSGGLVSNATSNVLDDPGNVQAQILVQNNTDTTIEDLTIDGFKNRCASDPIGIF